MMSWGSSPRVRGKRFHAHDDYPASRLIPACAGKTGRGRSFVHPLRAHPRVCGENITISLRASIHRGSSPRVRGKPALDPHQAGAGRLIPACAGKTEQVVFCRIRPGAHPRVCGENAPPRSSSARASGSSPRVRGKRRPLPHRIGCRGLIPACAGKTSRRLSPGRAPWAHPRVCGENFDELGDAPCEAGSSPRVRGKRRRRPPCRTRVRLIPACAGKTGRTRARKRGSRAHPRVCGENSLRDQARTPVSGSSPRVRGKRGPSTSSTRSPGLIPACAGKTSAPLFTCCGTAAHPRVCGENNAQHLLVKSFGGSSPRVRGKRDGRRLVLGPTRLIPACAGKT